VSLTVRTVAIDEARPLHILGPADAALERLLFARGDEGLVGWGVAARLDPGVGPGRFVRAQEQLAALAAECAADDAIEAFGSGLVAYGSFTFNEDQAGSQLIVPRVIIGRRDGVTWRTTITAADEPTATDADAAAALPRTSGSTDRPRFAGSSLRDDAWLAAVAHAITLIDAADLEKVVLARDQLVWSKEAFDVDTIGVRLAERFPSCFTFLIDGLLGASPELLLRRQARAVTSQVLAGTAARGDDAADDAARATALLASDKDLREHAIAAVSVREVLAPRCSRLDAPEVPELLTLDNVQHLATPLRGELLEPTGVLELLGALHPTAAVGGMPRAAALTAIGALEGMDRGRYAAPVGWVSPSGDGEWAIALRCGEFTGTRARLFAGAGVVAGSLPEQELEETWLKLRAMRGVLEG
jgi:menaquinone-specific isochorismate synthase